jgi:hypothetical protein
MNEMPEQIKEVVEKMRDGWSLRWARQRTKEPFLEKRGELEVFEFPVQYLFYLLGAKLVEAKNSRSIIEYYYLTKRGKTISL